MHIVHAASVAFPAQELPNLLLPEKTEMENGFGREKHGCNFPLSRVVNNGDKNKFSITLKQNGEK